ncbi:hypothetical protein BDV95DRAFT_43673 [Massariosphaeria phaeospora]|uniref:Uncharacterized protein n=1 Tax=Massariosphaeria phaeospora TaxID=100035 RepID=A0A7C8M830_9PLEO|nr:hypothetical protein BDV95DRAFT_43673 [Massariosphaeria phaeospora]
MRSLAVTFSRPNATPVDIIANASIVIIALDTEPARRDRLRASLRPWTARGLYWKLHSASTVRGTQPVRIWLLVVRSSGAGRAWERPATVVRGREALRHYTRTSRDTAATAIAAGSRARNPSQHCSESVAIARFALCESACRARYVAVLVVVSLSLAPHFCHA